MGLVILAPAVMRIKDTHYRSIWVPGDLPKEPALNAGEMPEYVRIIDQRWLPHRFVEEDLGSPEEAFAAIREMHVRGAPLIGATAAFGMYLAALQDTSSEYLGKIADYLAESRPTAVNLFWALDRCRKLISEVEEAERLASLYRLAREIADEDVNINAAIGRHALVLIKEISEKKSGPVNILTHCNAGWLATVDWGTATSPIYQAHDAGIEVHVWVDETRPRNQGARLTAWELANHGVPHTLITDNTGGHLMQHGQVDLVITGTDRTTRSGDVCNKIGTYLKALAAFDTQVPFYVALPSPTIDWSIRDGIKEIPIELRGEEEVHFVQGSRKSDGQVDRVRISPEQSRAANYAFDVTPARLVTGLITERGIAEASEEGLLKLFPEMSEMP